MDQSTSLEIGEKVDGGHPVILARNTADVGFHFREQPTHV
jgi:hypothetical protein